MASAISMGNLGLSPLDMLNANMPAKASTRPHKPTDADMGPHNFGGGDMFQRLKLAPGNYTIVFQWVDDIYSVGETGGTKNDMDIYLTPGTDGTALFGFNRDNTDGDPIEFIPFTIPGTDSVEENIFIFFKRVHLVSGY